MSITLCYSFLLLLFERALHSLVLCWLITSPLHRDDDSQLTLSTEIMISNFLLIPPERHHVYIMENASPNYPMKDSKNSPENDFLGTLQLVNAMHET